jgi:AAA domain, putative AbiEii toxin, Type IV TA system
VALTPRLSTIDLRRFKAFRNFSVSFGDTAVLIGPNNAGKTTVIGAITAASHMLRLAKKFKANRRQIRGDDAVWAYEFSTSQVGLDEDSLRWESRDEDVQVRLTFADGSQLTALWPWSGGDPPHFFIESADHRSPRQPAEVKAMLPAIDVVPALSPLERREDLHDSQYVRDSIRNRYASRNFRNQLLLCHRGDMPGCDWTEWTDFLHRWLPEISLGEPELTGSGINLFYRDEMAPAWKEIVWAGDGFQVFVQELFHLYRLREANVVVLDEPDIYLHADLQRRLVQAALSSQAQLILATHSAEIAAEVGTSAIVWMDRTRSQAIRAPSDDALSRLSGSIGSQFNLRLARVLRARLTLFVEGDDAVHLKQIARTIGCLAVANERDLAIVPIEGRDWKRLEGLAWLNQHLFAGSIQALLVVDRDYHSAESIEELRTTLHEWGVALRVWERKELESYLLSPALIARVSGAAAEDVTSLLDHIAVPMYEEVLFQHVATWKQDFPEDRHLSDSQVAEKFGEYLSKAWEDPSGRLWRCPAKECLAALNRELERHDGKTVSFDVLVRQMRASEVPSEVVDLLRYVEKRLS